MHSHQLILQNREWFSVVLLPALLLYSPTKNRNYLVSVHKRWYRSSLEHWQNANNLQGKMDAVVNRFRPQQGGSYPELDLLSEQYQLLLSTFDLHCWQGLRTPSMVSLEVYQSLMP